MQVHSPLPLFSSCDLFLFLVEETCGNVLLQTDALLELLNLHIVIEQLLRLPQLLYKILFRKISKMDSEYVFQTSSVIPERQESTGSGNRAPPADHVQPWDLFPPFLTQWIKLMILFRSVELFMESLLKFNKEEKLVDSQLLFY
jgi:hypothetical protein